jgi:hypothetical protein
LDELEQSVGTTHGKLTPADRMVSAGLCDNRFRRAATPAHRIKLNVLPDGHSG